MLVPEILVTGATGNIGREVVHLLSARGVPLTAAVHSRALAQVDGPFHVRTIHIDYRQRDTLQRALSGVRKVFFTTPVVPDQVALAKSFLDAARAAGVQHIVRLSSFHARTGPASSRGYHGPIEECIEASGMPWTMIRPMTFMQNFTTYWGAGIRECRALRLPCGEGRVSYVDARDVAAVVAVALTTGGHIGASYALTGPCALSLEEVARTLSQALGARIAYVDVTPATATREMKHAGMEPWLLEGMLRLFARYSSGADAVVTSTVKQVLGRDPIGFERFATDYAPVLQPIGSHSESPCGPCRLGSNSSGTGGGQG